MAIRAKIVDTQKLKKVFLKKRRKHIDEYSYSRLVLYLGDLKSKGYFYNQEQVWSDELCMEFIHFLTQKKLYLHIKRTSYSYKQGEKVTMRIAEENSLRSEVECVVGDRKPYFDKILWSCGSYLKESELQGIYDIALREYKTDSLLTVLAKNHYVQQKVGRISSITDSETKMYWVGEFLNEEAGTDEAKYLYLVQVQTEVKESKGTTLARLMCYMVSPEWYMMRTREPLSEICMEDGVTVQLQEMLWQNRPFERYYDLPNEEFPVYGGTKEELPLTCENLSRVFEKLYQEGYQYRRERTYPAAYDSSTIVGISETQVEIIGAESGIDEEYVKCGLDRVEIEFVKRETRERKLVTVEPKEIIVELNNGDYGAKGIFTSCFRLDQACVLKYYGEEESSTYMDDYSMETVFPSPVFRTLLEQYQLISIEQLQICHLIGQREFRDWFYYEEIPFLYSADEQGMKGIRDKEIKKAGRVRRIARGLKFHLLEEYPWNNYKVEIYANEEKSRAIYLLDDGLIYHVKYVDEYMDVNSAHCVVNYDIDADDLI